MKRPAKKSASKKAAKKPAARRPAASGKSGGKVAKAKPRPSGSASDRPPAEPYMPKPIEGVGWPAFRYPLQ